MIVEMRTYALHPGQQAAFLARMHEGIAIERPILGQLLGFYTSEIGALNQVVHLWGYASLAERERRRAQLAAAPAWQAFVPSVLPMIREMDSRILAPAPFAAVHTLDWAGPFASTAVSTGSTDSAAT